MQTATEVLPNEKITVKLPEGPFQIIYADPPWSYDDKSLNRGGAERHYRTMPIQDIFALPVQFIAAPNCALFLWATFPKLVEALAVIDAWGFCYKTAAFFWIKSNRGTEIGQSMFFAEDDLEAFWGMGRWTRSNAEACLLAVRGAPRRLVGSVHQIIYAPVARHSEKPAETRDRIVTLMGDVPRIELFARAQTPGWTAWGKEV